MSYLCGSYGDFIDKRVVYGFLRIYWVYVCFFWNFEKYWLFDCVGFLEIYDYLY